MPKKTFKNSTAHLDRFFSNPDENGTQKTQETYKTRRAQRTQTNVEEMSAEAASGEPFPAPAGFKGGSPLAPTEPRYYRLNLKLKTEYKEYLERVSWEAHKSITQYLNDLIGADMAAWDAVDI